MAFSDAEVKRVLLSLGPWPPPRVVDPSNRVSGKPAAIAFGAQLFNDPSLSRTGSIACATCHPPTRAFTDGRPRAHGIDSVDRNATSVVDVGGQRWYGWDGADDNLWAQSLRPIVDAREMGGDVARLASRIRSDTQLRGMYVAAFGAPPPAEDEALAVDAAEALAAYQETLVTGRTPFDDFRDALARGDKAAMAKYPVLAQRGLAIFVGSGNCTMCHGGPRLSNGEFHDVGIRFFVEPGRVDPGRHAGIRKLQASRYNLLGPYNDDPARSTATGAAPRRARPPQLRRVQGAVAAQRRAHGASMHDGSLATPRIKATKQELSTTAVI